MNIAQISYFYRPIRGGQEVYIQNLQHIFGHLGFTTRVYQPNWGGKGADIQTVPRIPLIGRIIPYASHHVFNRFLRLGYRKALAKADVIIVHYPIHAWPVRDLEENVIILSHGIDWDLGANTRSTGHLERIGREALKRFTFVANDTHYYRHFGLDVKPGSSYFQEILPGKWFIPNCIDTRLFSGKKENLEIKQQKFILVPRQITPDRGILLAIEAFYLFARDHPGYKLAILGPVPKSSRQYFRRCQSRVAEIGMENKIIFLPPVPNMDMPTYYASAQATLIPTLRREGTSLSALESMACGTPTLSTNVAGLLDLPTVKADPEPAAIADGIAYVIEHANEIASQQSNRVRQVFNMVNWQDAWLRVIRQITQKTLTL